MFKDLLGGDYTPLEHAVISVVLQLFCVVVSYPLCVLTPSVIVLSALFGCATFFGREHAQAEMRIKSARKSKELSWGITISALKFWEWDRASFMDLFVPVLCNIIVTICVLLFI